MESPSYLKSLGLILVWSDDWNLEVDPVVHEIQAKEHQMVRRFPPEKDDGSGLFTSKLGLQFWIRESHLDHDGKVK